MFKVVALVNQVNKMLIIRRIVGRPRLIPLMRLRAHAMLFGWDISNVRIFALMAHLNVAGRHGWLRFSGYKYVDAISSGLAASRGRHPITQDEWQDLELCANGFLNYDTNDNGDMCLQRISDIQTKVFTDICVEMSWIQEKAWMLALSELPWWKRLLRIWRRVPDDGAVGLAKRV
jgi:hypothetical protein